MTGYKPRKPKKHTYWRVWVGDYLYKNSLPWSKAVAVGQRLQDQVLEIKLERITMAKERFGWNGEKKPTGA